MADSAATGDLRQTALNAAHRRMGAKMVEFGGWDMPVRYSGDLEEHRAVRAAALVLAAAAVLLRLVVSWPGTGTS